MRAAQVFARISVGGMERLFSFGAPEIPRALAGVGCWDLFWGGGSGPGTGADVGGGVEGQGGSKDGMVSGKRAIPRGSSSLQASD